MFAIRSSAIFLQAAPPVKEPGKYRYGAPDSGCEKPHVKCCLAERLVLDRVADELGDNEDGHYQRSAARNAERGSRHVEQDHRPGWRFHLTSLADSVRFASKVAKR